MKPAKPITTAILLLSLFLMAFGIPKNIEKKVHREVSRIFEVEQYELQVVTVPASLNAKLPAKITTDNFFRVDRSGKLIGYVYVDQAPSKTAKFDYLVVFDQNLKVVDSKVLVYREEYGGEIGSKRWLNQFQGKSGNDRVSHETNIDAIAGATISVRSMTRSMDNLLQTIGILQENSIL